MELTQRRRPSRRDKISLTSLLLLGLAALLLTGCGKDLTARTVELTTVDVSQADEEVQEKMRSYQKRVAAEPGNASFVGELGILFELHGFSHESLTAYEIAETLAPEEFRWSYYHAILLAARFDLDTAIVKIDEAILKQPDYAPALIQKGKLLLDQSKYAEALEAFLLAAEDSIDPYVYIGQALAHLELDAPDAALSALANTGRLTEHTNVKRLRATAMIRLGRQEEAKRLLDGLPQLPAIRWADPIAEAKGEHAVQHFINKLNDAIQLIRARAYESSLVLLMGMQQERPHNKHVLHFLSSAYEGVGNDEAALQTLEFGMQHHPDFYVYYTTAASLLEKKGEVDKAIQYLDDALEIDPNLHWAYEQKARILMERKEWLAASLLLDQAIGLKEDDADLYTYLGICMGFLDRWPEAANLYKVAISIDDKHVPSYINLARAETFLGNETAALKAMTDAQRYGASNAMLASLQQQRNQIKRMNINVVRK